MDRPVRETGDDGQGHDAQHIVNDGGGQDDTAGGALEFAQLPEGLHGDAHRGGCEDDAQKDVLQEERTLGTSGVVNQQGGIIKVIANHKASGQGQQDARHGNEEGRAAAAFELIDVGFHAGGEHEQHHTQAGGGVEELGLLNDAQHRRTQQQAGHQGPYHLRHPKALGTQPQNLRTQQDQGQVQEVFVAHRYAAFPRSEGRSPLPLLTQL